MTDKNLQFAYNLLLKSIICTWKLINLVNTKQITCNWCENYCSNLSAGVALNARFTTNGMCAKNNTHIYVARTSNNRVIVACDLYCCLLLQSEALRTCCSGFPIATLWCPELPWLQGSYTESWLKCSVKITCLLKRSQSTHKHSKH